MRSASNMLCCLFNTFLVLLLPQANRSILTDPAGNEYRFSWFDTHHKSGLRIHECSRVTVDQAVCLSGHARVYSSCFL